MSGVYDEFQRRIKAEKESERQKKTESAKILQGYRGTDAEEALKLKAFKEEERRKQLEAEKNLREYRGGLNEEDLKLKAIKEEERRKQLDAENYLRSFKKKEEPDAKKRPERKDPDVPYPPASAKVEDDSLSRIQTGLVSEKKATFDSPSSKPRTTVGATGHNLISPQAPTVPFAIDQDFTMVSPLGEKKTEFPNISSEDFDFVVISHGEHAEYRSVADVDETQQQPSEPSITVNSAEYRFDFYFSFGIITDAETPCYEAYMAAASDLVQAALLHNSSIRFNASHPPCVVNEQWDSNYSDPNGRPNVRRVLVTAATPFILMDGASVESAQSFLIETLQSAIADGRFLQLARKSQKQDWQTQLAH